MHSERHEKVVSDQSQNLEMLRVTSYVFFRELATRNNKHGWNLEFKIWNISWTK